MPESRPNTSAATETPWHTLGVEEVLAQSQARPEGLSEAEANTLRGVHGRNELPSRPPTPVWAILLRQLRNPIIYILIIAAVVSLATGHFTDAAFIAAVVVLNALIGGFQEHRADRSAHALQQLLKIRAVVLRDNEPVEIDAREVVPGDIVLLESGNRIPADMRLISTHGLEVDESLLTGESLAVSKDFDSRPALDASVADRKNMTFAGSIAVSGRGRGVVVATGLNTQVGRLALDVLRTPPGKPPLLLRLERFTHVVGGVVVVAAVLIGIAGVVIHGYTWLEMFVFGVALAVSAIPEGLPVAITIALAVAARRMAQRGVIVRRLHAVEGLGSCSLIASDKTGTLTCNELTVREICLADGRVLSVSGQGFIPTGQVMLDDQPIMAGEEPALAEFLRVAVLCNEATIHKSGDRWVWHGDPTDVALLSAAMKAGQEPEAERGKLPLEDQIPFEPERRFAATFHRHEGQTFIAVKGAPERVLSMCAEDEEARKAHLGLAEVMAQRGLRVLALAAGSMEKITRDHEAPRDPTGLRFVGLVGMIDPLREGVQEAIAACIQAGIRVWMVTGDHPVTALAIAGELGLAERPDQVVTGGDLEKASDEELKRLMGTARVFARVAPHQKLQITKAAQAHGHFVAMTGDGANDAPALRAANIGVAMGRSGTDVARESVDLIISDDNFATIVAGVEEGRVAYDNIRKVVLLLASCGAAEVVLLGLAVLTGTPLPLLPVQILWLNLVTNGIQHIGLVLEPSEGDVMQRKPRPPGEKIFNQIMIANMVTSALIMGLLGFAAFLWMLDAGWEEATARNGLLLLMVQFEFVHIGNCRSETKSAFYLNPLRSPFLLVGALSAMAVHVAMMYLPLGQKILQTEPVDLLIWMVFAAMALVPMIALEIQKPIMRKLAARRGS